MGFKKYLIVGNGRVATHFAGYLKMLDVPYLCYARDMGVETLQSFLEEASHVLLLIKDGAIDEFIVSHLVPYLETKVVLHFSGFLVSPYIASAHPLMTFNQSAYSLETYQSILFVCEQGRANFTDLLPRLPNKCHYIAARDKPYYHAMCVMANNFTTILWQNFARQMEDKFGIEFGRITLFLEQTNRNIAQDVATALTGPLVRGDKGVIKAHLGALEGDPLQELYAAFYEFYQKIK